MFTQLVRQFSMMAAGEKLPNTPQKLTKKDIQFLCDMVSEELQELKDAKDIGEQADALVDAIYFVFDTAAKKGINLDPIFSIVHENNLTKVSHKKVTRSQKGKILKPDHWKDPGVLIKKEIEKQTNHGSFDET